MLDHATGEIARGSKLGIDATKQLPGEGFKRPWPPLIRMSEEVRTKIDGLYPAGKAPRHLEMPSEADARIVVDRLLREAGWEIEDKGQVSTEEAAADGRADFQTEYRRFCERNRKPLDEWYAWD